MAGSRLGTAYVQIIPSAQGISGKIKEALSGEADSAGIEAGNKVGSGLVGKIKTAIAAAGIGAALKAAIGEGAALEQSVLRRILCKRYSTNVKNGAVFCACAGLNSLGYRSPVQALQYARPQGVNAARACREAYSLGIR